ncbi:MAG TPA: hypothetical protein VLF14_08195, partial [Candidatus Binatia bacterium]|nr:hypothetical protein [Candidatus Binatia bacterium]
ASEGPSRVCADCDSYEPKGVSADNFRIVFASPRSYILGPVAKAFPPITINGTLYRVLCLSRTAFGPRFLLRDDAGRLFGLFERGADASCLYAVPLGRDTVTGNPLDRLDFLVTDTGLVSRC